MKRWVPFAVVALAVTACQDASGPAAKSRPTVPTAALIRAANPIPGSYIVVMNDAVANVDAEVDEIGQHYGISATFRYKDALKGFAGNLSAATVDALRNDPRVAYIEEDSPVHADVTQTPATWGLDRIDQRALPLSNSYTYSAAGTGVTVYIIDTGIWFNHAEFGGRAKFGVDEISPSTNGVDCNGHGTHTAGTVGGSTYGVAKNVNLVAVRVLDCSGSGSFAGVIAGIDWVTARKNANPSVPSVANMSLGGGADKATDDAVTRSTNAGVVYSISAGNSSADACLQSPARTPSAITVAATDITDTRASFSNFGTCVDIFAPGVNITSSWHTDGSTSTTETNTISGTSMSAPHVAGAAALYLQTNPSANVATVTSALTTNATLNVVKSPGSGSPNRLLYTGFINAAPAPPVADFSFSCTQLACNFDGSLSSAQAGATYTWAWGDATANGSGKIASHTYAASGTYNVTLTVTDGLGTSSKTKAVTVSNAATPAVANFTASCPTLSCTFTNTSTGVASGATHVWAWGDGSPNTTVTSTATQTHTYTTAGNKSVTLTVTNPGAAASSITKTVTPRNCVNGNGDC